MDKKQLAQAFNEWMRRYTEEPERFKCEWETIVQFLEETKSGAPTLYGECCADYLLNNLLKAGK